MKIQITMTRKEVVRCMKMIDVIGDIILKVFGKTFKKVNFSVDSQMNHANNNVSYGVGYKAEVFYTPVNVAVSIDIKEKMYDASCAFCEKVLEKAAPVVNFYMGIIKMIESFCEKVAEKDIPMVNFFKDGIKMLEDFCKSLKSDVEIIRNECFKELEKELEDNARYAVFGMRSIDDNLQIVVFRRYADSKITDVIYDELYTKDAIAFEMWQLKAFGKELNDDKFIFDSLDKAIDEVNRIRRDRDEAQRFIRDLKEQYTKHS